MWLLPRRVWAQRSRCQRAYKEGSVESVILPSQYGVSDSGLSTRDKD